MNNQNICLKKVNEAEIVLNDMLGNKDNVRKPDIKVFKEYVISNTDNIKNYNSVQFAVASWVYERQMERLLTSKLTDLQKANLKYLIKVSKVFRDVVKELRYLAEQ